MTFAQVPAGASLFIDANTFVFHFGPHPTLGGACGTLLKRIKNQEITATTSANILSDVAHRLMTIEAMSLHGWPASGIVQRLRRHPQVVQSLSLFRQAVDDVQQMGISIIDPTARLVSAAAAISQQYGLLSGDALIIAMMNHLGLSSIASHDADFDQIPGVTRYAPT